MYFEILSFYLITFTGKTFNTQVCSRSYSSKSNLNQHMIIHDESKAFKCDVCFKVFSYKSKLKAHYRTHTGEKPFACQVCDRKFALKSDLVQHQATHSEVRSFKCSICPEGRYFKTKHQLANHMIYHYEPKFACSHCEYKTHTKYNLDRHLKTH